MMLGNLLQQLYNIADTLIVGRYVGADALAAVGSAYTLMTFLTSILLGLSMGSGVAVSLSFGRGDTSRMRAGDLPLLPAGGRHRPGAESRRLSAAGPHPLAAPGARPGARPHGHLPAGDLRRASAAPSSTTTAPACCGPVGDSVRPLVFLGASALLNIVLDLAFVLGLGWGVAGAAGATVLAQWLSGVGLCIYALATRLTCA